MDTRIFLAICCLLFVAGCNKDNEESRISFSYSSAEFTTMFRTTGSTGVPSINWEGDTGSFSLKSNVQGVTIDAGTGEVFWDRGLNAGVNEVRIEALNGETSEIVTLKIVSTISSAFWNGGLNNDSDSNEIPNNRHIWFYEDGTIAVQIPDDGENSSGVGTWELEGDEMKIHLCTYCSGINPFSVPTYNEHTLLRGTLANTSLKAFIEGLWYVKYTNPDSENVRGYFYLEWD